MMHEGRVMGAEVVANRRPVIWVVSIVSHSRHSLPLVPVVPRPHCSLVPCPSSPLFPVPLPFPLALAVSQLSSPLLSVPPSPLLPFPLIPISGLRAMARSCGKERQLSVGLLVVWPVVVGWIRVVGAIP